MEQSEKGENEKMNKPVSTQNALKRMKTNTFDLPKN